MDLVLKYDLRAPEHLGATPARQYDACLQQCRWADERGFSAVRLNTHHGSEDGYLPSAATMGAAISTVTRRLAIRPSVIVLPLHDPIILAEDLAVLDNLSAGRLLPAFGAGYVAAEFAMFGRDMADRVEMLEEGVEALRRAWTGEPFTFRDRPVRVTPRPYDGRTIPIVLGGSSRRAARQAARMADGFDGPRRWVEAYLQACRHEGREPGWTPPPGHEKRLVMVVEDPDLAWAELGPFLLHENNWYGVRTQAGGITTGFAWVDSIDELRARDTYLLVTPEECLDLARPLGPAGQLELHPLVGGISPGASWASLELFEREVLPHLPG